MDITLITPYTTPVDIKDLEVGKYYFYQLNEFYWYISKYAGQKGEEAHFSIDVFSSNNEIEEGIDLDLDLVSFPFYLFDYEKFIKDHPEVLL